MIRYEAKSSTFSTTKKMIVGCESTIEDAKSYIKGLVDNGVEIIEVTYFDNAKRIADIQNGAV